MKLKDFNFVGENIQELGRDDSGHVQLTKYLNSVYTLEY